jgi:hypothetical protein
LKPTGGDQSFGPEGLHLDTISVQFLTLFVTQGRVHLVIYVFIVDVVVLQLLILLLNRCALSCWDPKYHQLNLKRLLLLRCMLWCVVLWLLRLWQVPRFQRTTWLMTSAHAYGVARMNHLSFRKRRV